MSRRSRCTVSLLFKGGTAPLRAVGALADAARNADRIVGRLAHQIETVGIYEVTRVGNLAAERDRIARPRRAEAAVTLRKLGCNAEKAHSIWCFGELADNAAWRLERLMHVP
jgi:hypothetical protein